MDFLSACAMLIWTVLGVVLFIKYYKVLKRIENLTNEMERKLNDEWVEKV